MAYKNMIFSHEQITEKRKYTEFHFHDEYELYFLINGETKYFIENEFFQLHKGNFIFVPKGVLHKTDSEDCLYNERILLSITERVFDESMLPVLEELSREKLFYVSANNLPVLERLLHKIETEHLSHNKHKKLMILNYTRELLILICRHKITKKQELSDSDKFIIAIPEYIAEHLAENITLKSLSKQFAFSEEHLSRKFKSVFGVGLNKYISYMRVLHAEKLLTETDCSITEIASLCGFNDSNYFSTVFKKTLGVPPLKYRKR